ncbi:MAG: sigma-54-dependent Fis family transcriptional regulator, partial [Gemmatimonadetes bacterium]|nr:sigma-54-dependent Fis family transcriptional regulator [Gemmatimonadota bacterium]
FRILAATNADLGAAVESGAFRADLYYRIEGLKLTMPPLRDRPEDIRLLAEHFLGDNAVSMQLPADALRFTSEAMRAMERYRWPGNVRELRQAVHSSAVLRNLDTNELGVDALPEQIATAADREASIQGIDASLLDRIATVADEIGAPDLLSEIRDHLTDRALATTEGKKRAAARALGMRESTLRRQLKIRDKTKGDGGS